MDSGSAHWFSCTFQEEPLAFSALLSLGHDRARLMSASPSPLTSLQGRAALGSQGLGDGSASARNILRMSEPFQLRAPHREKPELSAPPGKALT